MRIVDVNNEDIVDVLAEVKDPVAIEPLLRALNWENPEDEYGQLSVKCVWALEAIGTAAAVNALESANKRDLENVRNAIELALEKIR